MNFVKTFIFIQILTVNALAARYQVKVQELTTVSANSPVLLGHLLDDQFKIEDLDLYEKIHRITILDRASEGETEISGSDIISKIRQTLSFTDLQRVSFSLPENTKIKSQRNFF